MVPPYGENSRAVRGALVGVALQAVIYIAAWLLVFYAINCMAIDLGYCYYIQHPWRGAAWWAFSYLEPYDPRIGAFGSTLLLGLTHVTYFVVSARVGWMVGSWYGKRGSPKGSSLTRSPRSVR